MVTNSFLKQRSTLIISIQYLIPHTPSITKDKISYYQVDQSSSSLILDPYFRALLAFSISFFLFSMALLLIRSRYCSKVIYFSKPSGVFSSPSKITSIYCYSFFIISFYSHRWLCLSNYSLALTNSNYKVSSTVILYRSGLQYIKNWVRWNKFLLSAAVRSIVQRLYILVNYLSVIFLFKSSSNSQTILSTSFRLILDPSLRSTAPTSASVKNLPPCAAAKLLKTFSKYFSSVVLIWNSSNFSSIVFYF